MEKTRINKRTAFTLAEVLITIATIGVVTALTLPMLITKINSKVMEKQEEVFRAKMIKGFNLTKGAGELNNTYSSTYDFLTNGLGKHLKLVKICEPSNIRECIPYDIISFIRKNKEETIETKKLGTVRNLNLREKDGYKDSAAFILGDGTVVVGAYKLDCVVDDGELDKEINECFDGLYDLNGSRKPNKLGKDIFPIRLAGIYNGPAIMSTLGNIEFISKAQRYNGVLTSEYCKDGKPIKEYADAGVNTCCTDCDSNGGDRWAAAMKACYDIGGHLPTEQQLAEIVTIAYGGRAIGGSFSGDDPLNSNYWGREYIWTSTPLPTALRGCGTSMFSQMSDGDTAYGRYFDGTHTHRFAGNRSSAGPTAVCVVD